MYFRARKFEYRFPRPTLIMGIVNATPDSFSDGGRYFQADQAVAHGLHLAKSGADIIDIGGESTRPGAAPVTADEEINRVVPVIKRLASQLSIPLSIDTMKPAVAQAALQAGASIVNDVAANRADEEMWRITAESGAGYVLMHMLGSPQTMQRHPHYENVIGDIGNFFEERLARVAAAGVQKEQVILDVGIGFGKTLEHNLQLMRSLRRFTRWARPLLLGVSRKSFMGTLLDAPVQGRLPASLACACWAVREGVQIIRTHDVSETRQAVGMTEALLQDEHTT